MLNKTIIALTLSLACLSANTLAKGQRPTPPSFSEMDTNGNGTVSLEEFSNTKLPPGLDASTAFGHIDSDGNGELSEQEVADFKPPRRAKK